MFSLAHHKNFSATFSLSDDISGCLTTKEAENSINLDIEFRVVLYLHLIPVGGVCSYEILCLLEKEISMEFWNKIVAWFDSTHLQEQIKEVDFVGLFTNPWFIVPFAAMIVYMLIKLRWKDLIIVTIFVAIWWVSGTTYMNTLIIGDELQINKILPVIFGGAAVLGFVIYLLFGRSD